MSPLHRQSGATLLVGLVILIAITLFVLSAYTTSSMSLRSTANTQFRAEAHSAAQQAIDVAVSSNRFIDTPADVFPSPCGAANTLCPDVTGDGTPDYTVRLSPQPFCKRAKAINNDELDVNKAEDLACAAGQSQQFGVAGVDVTSGDSLCSSTTWEVTAEATGTIGGAKVVVSQGIGVRVAKDAVFASCL
jgi:Tfp pilus assembly protein PilX